MFDEQPRFFVILSGVLALGAKQLARKSRTLALPKLTCRLLLQVLWFFQGFRVSVGRGKFADCGIRGIWARLAGSGFRI